MQIPSPRLAIDIGGTNFRIAQVKDNKLNSIEQVSCRDFSGPQDILQNYLQKHSIPSQASVCMAVAGPVQNDSIQLTNVDWSYCPKDLAKNLELKQLFTINDFHAMSLAIPNLEANDFKQIGQGNPKHDYASVVCGPGTGLGLSHLIPHKGEWVVMPGEGGHGDFAPNNEREAELWQLLYKEQNHVYIERLLSGPGLETLYRLMCQLEGKKNENLNAAAISANATKGNCKVCVKTLDTFCAILGSYCGSIALNAGALGGVYLTGGVLRNFLEFFTNSQFRQRFEDKGSYKEYMNKIPTYVVTCDYPGLIGAAHYLQEKIEGTTIVAT